ncbi:MAG: recombination protein RecR [Flavobacteriales bacterium]
MFSPLIDELILALRILPGVGPKTAQRMALHLLEHDRPGAGKLAESLVASVERVGRCTSCRNLTEQPKCIICSSSRRDQSLVCVVESPADVLALEQSGSFSGRYFVLHGKLSPIDGFGPKELGLDELETQMSIEQLVEIIIATNPSVEGEATAHYISEKARKKGVKTSRIAHGVPIGGELEYIDGGTLAHALNRRVEM